LKITNLLAMSLNPYTKSIETKLYFIVFALFSSFLTIMIYNFSLDTVVTSDLTIDEEINMLLRHRGAAGNNKKFPQETRDINDDYER